MFAIKIEKISNSNLDIYFATMSKKYKIPKTKLKKMWLDRNQSYVIKNLIIYCDKETSFRNVKTIKNNRKNC